MRLWRCAAYGLLLVSLAGCLGSGGGSGGGSGASPGRGNPITGDAIAVSALGAPPPAQPASAAAPAAALVAPAQAVAGQPGAGAPAAETPGNAQTPGKAETPGKTAADPAPLPEDAAVKSPGQLACEKRKGQWSGTASGFGTCVSYTKDASKSCSRSGDCQGECLARSGSCSPVTPLYGCHEILDAMGRLMTQCLQ